MTRAGARCSTAWSVRTPEKKVPATSWGLNRVRGRVRVGIRIRIRIRVRIRVRVRVRARVRVRVSYDLEPGAGDQG